MAILGQEMPKFDLNEPRLSDARREQPEFFSVQIAEARRFQLRLSPPAGKRLAVLCGGVERCSDDYQIRRSTFPYFGLEFVAGGRGELMLQGKRCRLVPGTLFSYGPRIRHHITTAPGQPLVKYFVDFAGSGAARLLRTIGLPPGSAAQTAAPAEVMPIFDELIRNGARNSGQSPDICAAMLEALLYKLAETRVPLGSVESAAFETFQRCVRTLERDALHIESLQELSARCLVDQAYLCRLFKRFDHESPYRRLLRLKMSHAAARMQTPGTLVKEVAAELGFTDPYHFSRAFKSVFGVSPTRLVRE
jgi:AraC-like DNA-binding protein